MDRTNPYEAAFEGYLKANGLCFVGVDESRRAMLGDTPVKNLDFVVLGEKGAKLLVDVKGRQFPGGKPDQPKYTWESWSTQEDITGLTQWTSLFGPGYTALFVFMYRLGPGVAIDPSTPDLWRFREETYLLRGVALDEYQANMKIRSPKWGTVYLPSAVFQRIVRPFYYFSRELPGSGEEEIDGSDSNRGLRESVGLALQACALGGGEAWH